MTPYGYPHDTVKSKKRRNGYPHDTVEAQNVLSTGTPMTHLQLPGRGREPGVLLPSPEGELAEKKPWSTPTVEEVPWDTLPTEMRMLVLGLPDPELGCYGRTARAPLDAAYQATTEKQPVELDERHTPEALMTHVADVIEEQLRNLDEARKAKREADQRVSAPDPVPARPMLEGDRRREAICARNQEALRRYEAEIKERLH